MTTANPACRRYLKKLSLGFAVYAATLMIMNAILDNYTVPYALSILLVLLPMTPVVYIIRVVVEYVRTWDEMQQRLYLEAAMIAFTLVGALTFAWGFLEDIGFPELPTMWVFPMMMVTLALAQWYVTHRYR